MCTVLRGWGVPVLAALASILVLSERSVGQGGGQTDGKTKPRTTDQEIRAALKDVINRGADLFNPPRNDHDGCSRLYQGGLLALRPLLKGHPDLKKAADQGLIEAERITDPIDRSFALRKVLDRIRKDLLKKGGDMKLGEKKKGPVTEIEEKKKDRDKTVADSTLWKRLGGEDGVRKVVADFVASTAADPKVDFTRGGKYKVDVNMLQTALVEMISGAAGGPLRYTGPDMKEVHKGMHITALEFNRTVEHLKRALKENAVPQDAAQELLRMVESTRRFIVDPGETRKKGEKATVEGRVNYQGKPVTGGTVTFVAQGGTIYAGQLAADGTYRLVLPAGAYKVAIQTDSLNPKIKAGGKGKLIEGQPGQRAAAFVAIPARYASAQTSGLRATVANGANVFDIEVQ
jgi:truncated hemoglobin YjbI